MLSRAEAEARAAELVASARRAGADAAEAHYGGQSSQDVAVRLGELEDVGRSESERISLRLFLGRRSATVSASSVSGDAEAIVVRALEMARAAPEDPFAGLAPEELLATGALPGLDLADSVAPSPAELRDRALAAEDAARAISGVTNSEGASASFGQGVSALATSTGFLGSSEGTRHATSASVLAGSGSEMQRDHDWHMARHHADLEGAEAIGRRAGERAVARLRPAVPRSGAMPVLFDRRVSASLIGHMLGAISGPAIARRTSFLLDRLGEQLFPPGISIIDDPLRPRGLASRAFDGEGLPTRRTEVVQGGFLTTYLIDSSSGRQLGLPPTGHAAAGGQGVTATNVHLDAGQESVTGLMADIGEGVLVTELIGQGVNGVTGDYSRGATGFLIRDGQLAGPAAEFTIAGNLLSMFAALRPADDLVFTRASNAPTLRIDGMTVAGG